MAQDVVVRPWASDARQHLPIEIPSDHPWVTDRGIEILQKVQRAIWNEPYWYNQVQWSYWKLDIHSAKQGCGMACCIGGHTLMIDRELRRDAYWRSGDENYVCGLFGYEDVADVADRHILNGGVEHTLFTSIPADAWPPILAEAWEQTFDMGGEEKERERARIACLRIDRFLETGE